MQGAGQGKINFLPDSVVRSSYGRNAGFTLFEILIAIAILALVVSSLYGAYSGTIETTEKVESLRDIDQTARLALMQMADDFKSLYYRKAESNEEDSPFGFSSGMEAEGEEETVVEFASTSHLGFDLDFPSLRVNRVRYVMAKQSDNERHHKLVRIEIPFADLPGEREEISVELADSVESLTLTYQNEDGQSFSQWDTKAEENAGQPPRLVNIKLQMAGDTSRIFTATVALRVWEEEEEAKK